MSSPEATLALFARAPVAGSVKTRLAAALTPEGAARLYRAFLEDAARVYAEAEWTPVLYADPAPDHPSFADLFAPPWRKQAQSAGDLGGRLSEAFRHEMARGASVVAAVGSDHPALPRRRIRETFDAVRRGSDVAIIPALDGGYCAIAMSPRVVPDSVFRGIPWSSPVTLTATLDRLSRRGVSVAILDAAADVDRPDDLERLRRDLAFRDSAEEDFPRATAAALSILGGKTP